MKYLMSALLLCQMALSITIPGPPTAKVITSKGNVTYSGKDLSKGDIIKDNGLIETGEKSYLRIYINKWQNSIVIGPNSSMELNLDKDVKKKYNLRSGVCRWVSDSKKILDLDVKGAVHTQSATFAVRGTDYFVAYNPLLNESEIIVFDGQVMFTSMLSKSDEKLINKGQWGGVGGRYGQKIGNLIDLPQSILDHFKKALPVE